MLKRILLMLPATALVFFLTLYNETGTSGQTGKTGNNNKESRIHETGSYQSAILDNDRCSRCRSSNTADNIQEHEFRQNRIL